MKKTIWIIALVVLALGVVGVGVVLAQDSDQPNNAGITVTSAASAGVVDRFGWMHDYVTQALAEKLGLTIDEVEAQFAEGKTMYQIALDNGVAEDEIASFLTEVHTAAFDQAVAEGVLTREQADWMLGRMQSRWANGVIPGTCPMINGQPGQGMMRNGAGGQGGPGSMMGGRWSQNP